MALATNSFPVPLSPLNEDRRIGLGDRLDQIINLYHLRALSHQSFQADIVLLPSSEEDILFLQLLHSEKSFDDKKEFIHGEGFCQIIARPFLHGRHSRIDGTVGCDHDHLEFRGSAF